MIRFMGSFIYSLITSTRQRTVEGPGDNNYKKDMVLILIDLKR